LSFIPRSSLINASFFGPLWLLVEHVTINAKEKQLYLKDAI
jgi:hypothetical protein